MASTVGTVTHDEAIRETFQRKGFFAATLFWVFYSDGTNYVYRTSADNITWSAATTVVAGAARGCYLSICFDGTYIHYAEAEGGNIFYRRGIPVNDGSITWSAAQQTITTPFRANYPSISVDTSGYVWIGYTDRVDVTNYFLPQVIKNADNDGTWTDAASFPYQLSATDSSLWRVSIVPLTSGKMYVVYSRSTVAGLGILWDGAAFGSEETTMSDSDVGPDYSVVALGNDVHLVFREDTSLGIYYNKRTYGVGWGTEVVIKAAATALSAPALSIIGTTLYCFWATKITNTPTGTTANHIYYQKSTDYGATWSAMVDWIDESTDVLTVADRLTCFYQAYGNYIGLVYMTKTSTPWNIRFAYLDVTPTVGTNLLRISFDLKTTDAGYTAYGRIYRNGVAAGTEQSTASTDYVTFTEDILFTQDDLLDLWCKVAAGGTYYCQNLRIKGTTPTASTNGFLGVNS